MRNVLLGFFVMVASASSLILAEENVRNADEWTTDFSADKENLTSTGKNPYFILEPGFQVEFEDDDEKVVK